MVGDPSALVIDAEVARLWTTACRLPHSLRQVTLIRQQTGVADWGDTHTVPTLVACLEGVARISLPRRVIDLHPGTIALIAPGCSHRHEALRAGSAILAMGFMLRRADIELTTAQRTWWLAIPEQPIRRLIEQACHSPASTHLRLVREALAGLVDESARPLAPMPGAEQRMWNYLHRTQQAPTSAAEVLRQSGLGPTQAHRLFRTWFGETPYRMLNCQRLEYARHLLASGTAVGLVASTCGFRTRRQFTAAFRLATGKPPSSWRGTP